MYTVDSVSSVNTHPHPTPNQMTQYASPTLIGKTTSVISFKECLNLSVQQARANAMANQAEYQKNGILMGYYLPAMVMPIPKMKLAFSDQES